VNSEWVRGGIETAQLDKSNRSRVGGGKRTDRDCVRAIVRSGGCRRGDVRRAGLRDRTVGDGGCPGNNNAGAVRECRSTLNSESGGTDCCLQLRWQNLQQVCGSLLRNRRPACGRFHTGLDNFARNRLGKGLSNVGNVPPRAGRRVHAPDFTGVLLRPALLPLLCRWGWVRVSRWGRRLRQLSLFCRDPRLCRDKA
jgi:hypothetical protein